MPNSRAVIVTGAAGGIGAAICTRLKRDGLFVIGTDCVPSTGNCDHFLQADLLDLADSPKTLAAVVSEFHEAIRGTPLHGLVHSAAVQIVGDIDELDVSAFRRTLAINVMAPYALTRALVVDLRNARGSVVHVTSVHSKLTKKGFALYATSKAALSGLTRSLALDLAPEIRVNEVSPAATDTSMLRSGFGSAWGEGVIERLSSAHPLGRIANPAEVASAVGYLLSADAQFVSGASLEVGGGVHCRLHDVY